MCSVALLVVSSPDTSPSPADNETGPGVAPGACTVTSTVSAAPGTTLYDMVPVLLFDTGPAVVVVVMSVVPLAKVILPPPAGGPGPGG